MKDHGLDPDTAERMLRGERTGPPPLAELLAAAAGDATPEELAGENAAAAAFAAARPAREKRRTRLALPSVSFALKAVAALLALLAGGVTVATASQHLPGPLGGGGRDHAHHARTPENSSVVQQPRTPSQTPSHATPRRSHTHRPHDVRPTTPGRPHASTGPRPKARLPHLPLPTKALPTPGLDGPEPESAPAPTDVSPSAEVSAGR